MRTTPRSFVALALVCLLPLAACGGKEKPQLGVAAGLEGQAALQAVLDEFSLGFDSELWLKQQAEYSQEGLASLAEGQVDELLPNFRLGRRLQLIEHRQTNHLVVVSLVEWASPESASGWIAAQRKLMGAMDDQVGVESAVYREVRTDDLAGFVAEKGLADFSGPYPSRSAVLAREKFVVEVTYLFQPTTDAALLKTARAFFDALGVEVP